MTTQTTSPFSSDANSINVNPVNIPDAQQPVQDDFLIRTMHSDLETFKQKGGVEAKQTQAVTVSSTNQLPKREIPLESEKKSQPASNNAFFEQPKPAPQKIIEVPTEKTLASEEENKPASIKIIASIIAILIICILGLGIYYIVISKNKVAVEQPINTPEPAPVAVATPQPQPEPTPIVEPQLPKYSQDKPNYLTIDPSTQDSEQIKNAFIKVENEIKSLNGSSTSPYEFIIVDTNNNPVAFPIFATAAKINLSQNVLTSLAPEFSVYFYNDNSNIRLAIASKISKKDQLMKELLLQEKNFPVAASFLFLDAQPDTKTGAFATSSYKNNSIRFLNVNAAKNLSIDYTTTPSQLIIATSKNTIRAVLDILEKQKQTEVQSSSPSTTSATVQKNPSQNSQDKIVQEKSSSSSDSSVETKTSTTSK